MINITTYLLASIILLVVYNFSKICSYIKFKRLLSRLPTIDQPCYPIIGHLHLFPKDSGRTFETFYKLFSSQQAKGQKNFLRIFAYKTSLQITIFFAKLLFFKKTHFVSFI